MEIRCPECDIEVNDEWICPLCGQKYTGTRYIASSPKPFIRQDNQWALECMGLLIKIVEEQPEMQSLLQEGYDLLKEIAEGE